MKNSKRGKNVYCVVKSITDRINLIYKRDGKEYSMEMPITEYNSNLRKNDKIELSIQRLIELP